MLLLDVVAALDEIREGQRCVRVRCGLEAGE